MSASDSSSECITVGKRYEDLGEGGWESVETVATDNEKHEEEVTEGGIRAWLTVLGSMLIYFAPFGIINSFGFFQNYYENSFLKGVPASTISLIGTTQIMLGNVLAGPAGVLFDCYGLKVCSPISFYVGPNLNNIAVIVHIFRPRMHSLAPLIVFCSTWSRILVADIPRPGRVARHCQCFRYTACPCRHWPAFRASSRTRYGNNSGRRKCWWCLLSSRIYKIGGSTSHWFCMVAARCRRSHCVSGALLDSEHETNHTHRVCYTIAILISSTNMPRQRLKSVKGLVDLRGFLDRRYSVLAVGAFIAMLGQFVPYYYISTDNIALLASGFGPTDSLGTYMQATNPNSPAKDYLLPLMNASSILGRIM